MNYFRKKDNQPVVVYKNSDYELVKTKISNLKYLKNWSKNRPADEVRVEQIKEYFLYKNIDFLPGVICIWNGFIYDGLHRFLAATKIHDKEIGCLVKFLNGTEYDCVEDFKHINSSVSLPFLYMEENNELKKKVCQNVTTWMCNSYPEFVSPSRNPRRYNFNRDNFMDFISKIDVDFSKNNVYHALIQELSGLNNFAKDYVIQNKIVHPKKCDYHNFFLFYLTNDFITNRLENVLRN